MVSGKETERQTRMKMQDLGLKEVRLYKPNGEEWESEELLDILSERTFGRIPGILQGRSRSVIANFDQKWMLDKGYKIDILLYSYKLGGYMGIDIMKYPLDEDWSYLQSKYEEIEELRQSGVYDAINVQKMGILLVLPQGKNEDEGDSDEEDKMLLDFFESLEEAEFMPDPGILDLREQKETLPEPQLQA